MAMARLRSRDAVPALEELEAEIDAAFADAAFTADLDRWLADYAGRPTPVTHARGLGDAHPGAQVWLKREDLLHTGAPQAEHALARCCSHIAWGSAGSSAETGAGQHGVATATACAALGLECVSTWAAGGHAPSVAQRLQDGAARRRGCARRTVARRRSRTRPMRRSVTGSPMFVPPTTSSGAPSVPHPYPSLVRRLQRVIGDEARAQMLSRSGRLPTTVVACVGGGSNAIGMFAAFLDDDVRLVGVEPPGAGSTAASMPPRSRGDAPVCSTGLSY